MATIKQDAQNQLERIKENTARAYDYFRDNYKRWHKFKKFLYVTSLDSDQIAVLQALGKPQLEFNILEAYAARQKGEFAKQEPSIKVGADSAPAVPAQLMQILEGHLRHIEKHSRDDNTAYEIYDDLIAGGFSVGRVTTDYRHEMTFEQEVIYKRVFDPTMCFFDPLARLSHKGDGDFCGEITVYREKEFKKMYPDVDTSEIKYADNFSSFSWGYKAQDERLILIADYYEKKKKSVSIVLLTNGKIMEKRKYEQFLIDFEMEGHAEQAPQIVGKSRRTLLTHIDRYTVIENKVLNYQETDYRYLPLVFFDGSSVHLRLKTGGPIQQVTRPYCFQALGIQQLKNFAGQTMANELENMVQHKWIAPVEGIPDQYADAYTNPQEATVVLYNAFKDNDPNVPLPKPEGVPRIPVPPEVTQTFMGADQTTQAILGSYDAALGINNNELSGIAVIESATQSNAAAMPYIVGYLNGLNQVALIATDLVSKYYITPRQIPILQADGKSDFVSINQDQSEMQNIGQQQEGQSQMQPVDMKFDSHALTVNVSAGANYAIQRSRALKQIVALMQVSPLFQEFITSTPQGLNALLDNIEMRGLDTLKDGVEAFLQQKQQQASQQPQDPIAMQTMQLKMQQLQIEMEKMQKQFQIDTATVAISDKNADTERLKVLGGLGIQESAQELEKDAKDAENARTAADLTLKTIDMAHKHNKELIGLVKK
jgi:hypothetical protein